MFGNYVRACLERIVLAFIPVIPEPTATSPHQRRLAVAASIRSPTPLSMLCQYSKAR